MVPFLKNGKRKIHQRNNMNKKTNLLALAIMAIVYFGARYTGFGIVIFGPIEILVAFLHEFGHASMGLLTGGHVYSLKVNPDGSGVTETSGGNLALITMGGYIGSCVFSNILVRASLSNRVEWICNGLAMAILFSAFWWFGSVTSTAILILYAIIFVVIGRIPTISPLIVQFVGIACVARVIEDFDIGPSSDLAAFQANVGILPYTAWMYLWLAIAIIVTIFNIRQILKNGNNKSPLNDRFIQKDPLGF